MSTGKPKSKLKLFVSSSGKKFPNLYIDELTGKFYIRIRQGKSVRTKCLWTKNLQEARAKINPMIAELIKPEVQVEIKPLEFVREYYVKMCAEKKAMDISQSTMKRISDVWDHSLSPFWANIEVSTINQDTVTRFIHWHRHHRPGIQLMNAFKYLGNLFNMMVKNGAFPENKRPVLDLPLSEKRHHQTQKGRYIQNHELQRIIKEADSTTKLIILIAACTGMRKMEIGNLELRRLKFSNDRYVIHLEHQNTKTGRARSVPLPKELTPLINQQTKGKLTYVFPTKRNILKPMSSQLIDKGWFRAKRRAGIENRLRFHDIRHTVATNLAKDGLNPLVNVTMLGMSLITYQRTYMKLSVDDLTVSAQSSFARLGDIHVL
jgi:integrase